MSEYRSILERARDQFSAPDMPLDRVLRHRDRRQRNRRIGTALIALVLAAAAIGGLVRAFYPPQNPQPAELPSTTRAWSRVLLDPREPGPRETVNAITAGGPGLVAVGSQGPQAAVWTSPDGRTWSRVPAELGRGHIADLTIGGPGLVAVGAGRDPVGSSVANGTVWTSSDGLSWGRAPSDGVFRQAWLTAVTVGGPGLVAVGTTPDGPQAWFSVDGVSWDRAAVPPVNADVEIDEGFRPPRAEARMDDVAVANGRLVAAGVIWTRQGQEEGVLWTSADGLTWTKVPHADAFPEESSVTSLAEGRHGLVAVGFVDTAHVIGAAWTSRDGLRWRRAPADQDAFVPHDPYGNFSGPGGIRSVAAGPAGYVAVGSDGQCRGGGGGVCPSAEAVVWTSRDGKTWLRVPTGPVFQPGGLRAELVFANATTVAAWGARFVAAGGYDGRAAIWVSEP